MSVNTRFYHLNASWENLLACCGMHLLRQNEGGEEERHWPRPRLSDLLASPSFRSCHRKPKHEPRGGPHPPRPEAGDGRSASDCAVTGASTRGSRSDPKRSGKQLLPVCFKKNAEHLLPMVFCDACGHGGGAGQVFTLQEEADASVGLLCAMSPWVGRRGPLFPVFGHFSGSDPLWEANFYSLRFPRDKLDG